MERPTEELSLVLTHLKLLSQGLGGSLIPPSLPSLSTFTHKPTHEDLRDANTPRTPESNGEDRSGRSFIHSFIHAISVY